MPKPQGVIFDVLGTLADLSPMRERLIAEGLPGETLQLWLARTLRDGFAMTTSRTFRSFSQIAAGALDVIAAEHGLRPERSWAHAVLRAMMELPLFPDVAAGLELVERAGLPAVTLSNGSIDMTRAILEKGGVASFVRKVVSIDEADAWKPHPAAYHLACERIGFPPRHLTYVTAHAWDAHGARRVGLTTGWVRRTEGRFQHAFDLPHAEGESLPDVVTRVLEAAERPRAEEQPAPHVS